MREILFRGMRKDNCEWVQGHLLKYEDGRARICESNTDIFCYEKDESIIQTVSHKVYPQTVGQYTGKDLCGEKLFEGDVIESVEDYDDKFGHPATSDFFSVVVWDEKNLCWAFNTDGHIQAFNDWTWEESIKVGNIHDNPELLEG